jgi:hypothetical protein
MKLRIAVRACPAARRRRYHETSFVKIGASYPLPCLLVDTCKYICPKSRAPPTRAPPPGRPRPGPGPPDRTRQIVHLNLEVPSQLSFKYKLWKKNLSWPELYGPFTSTQVGGPPASVGHFRVPAPGIPGHLKLEHPSHGRMTARVTDVTVTPRPRPVPGPGGRPGLDIRNATQLPDSDGHGHGDGMTNPYRLGNH